MTNANQYNISGNNFGSSSQKSSCSCNFIPGAFTLRKSLQRLMQMMFIIALIPNNRASSNDSCG